DDEEFGKTDVEHGPAPREAASALDVVVVELLVRRGLVRARLVAELPGGLVVVVAHALLELLDRAAKILGAAGQALGAENEQHDREHDQPVPDAQTAHGLSRMYVGGTRRIAQRVTGPAAAPRPWPGCPGRRRPAGRAAAGARRAPWRRPAAGRQGRPRRRRSPGRPPPAARPCRCRVWRVRRRWLPRAGRGNPRPPTMVPALPGPRRSSAAWCPGRRRRGWRRRRSTAPRRRARRRRTTRARATRTRSRPGAGQRWPAPRCGRPVRRPRRHRRRG